MVGLLLGVLALPWGARDAQAGLSGPGNAPDFAEYLAGFDLVVDGTISAVDTVWRERLGGCGVLGFGAPRSREMRIRVDRVILGTAEDSSIVITTLGRSQFPGSGLRVGARVIAWAFRNCPDGWRLWGNAVLVSPHGYLIPDYNNAGGIRLDGSPPRAHVRWPALDSSLAARVPASSVGRFDGAGAVALLRVTAIEPGPDRTYGLACDSVAVVVGSAANTPGHVDMDPGDTCMREVQVGDSIIVALPSGWAFDRLKWRGCPGSLLVKQGFARGFGVPIENLSHALDWRDGQVSVRPFHVRE